jgi:hypothetical protein
MLYTDVLWFKYFEMSDISILNNKISRTPYNEQEMAVSILLCVNAYNEYFIVM